MAKVSDIEVRKTIWPRQIALTTPESLKAKVFEDATIAHLASRLLIFKSAYPSYEATLQDRERFRFCTEVKPTRFGRYKAVQGAAHLVSGLPSEEEYVYSGKSLLGDLNTFNYLVDRAVAEIITEDEDDRMLAVARYCAANQIMDETLRKGSSLERYEGEVPKGIGGIVLTQKRIWR